MEINVKDILRENKNTIMVEDFPETTDYVSLTGQEEKNILLSNDGTTIDISSFASKYWDSVEGVYQTISTALTTLEDYFCNKLNLFETTIDRRTGVSKGLLLNDGTHSIKLVPTDACSDIEGVLSEEDSNKVSFNNFIDTDTLEYILKDSGVDMNIIISSSKKTYTYNFTIITSGVNTTISDDNRKILFTDSTTNEVVYTINNFYMLDTNGEYSTANTLELTTNDDLSHNLSITLNSDWMSSSSRRFPVTLTSQFELKDLPIITLKSLRNSSYYATDKKQVILGMKNGYNYSVKATINAEQILHELIANNIKKYNASVELHYASGLINVNSKGIEVYNGSTLISRNSLTSSEFNICVDITELVEKEMKKYKTGRAISNINLSFIYVQPTAGSLEADGYSSTTTIKNDYVIVKDRFNTDTELRPELHLNCVRNDEVKPGTPFVSYNTNKAGLTKLNLYNSELKHYFELGSIKENSLDIGVNMFYDTRLLKEQKENSSKSFLGNGWLLNLSQHLEKTDVYSKLLGSKKVIYFDDENNAHTFNEKWYYEVDDVRHYIPKDLVYIDADQELKYKDSDDNVYSVKYEAINEDGLILVSTNSRLNYSKKTDLKVHKRYFMTLYNESKYEVFMDDNGCLKIPQFYLPGQSIFRPLLDGDGIGVFLAQFSDDYEVKVFASNEDIIYLNEIFTNSSEEIYETEEFSRQLFYKDGKYYVRGLKYQYIIHPTNSDEDITYCNYDDDGVDIEIEVVKEYYVDRSIPTIDYYENENIANINLQITQTEEYIESLNLQTESIANTIKRIENDINYQKILRNKLISEEQVDIEDQIQTDSYRYQINALYSQLEDQQKTLKSYYDKLAIYETQLCNLKEQKNALVEEQKDGVQDYILDEEGNVLGFDYYGHLIYISDAYENEIYIYYEDNKIVEISSSKQKMIFHYSDENLLDYVIDAQGRKMEFFHYNNCLDTITFIAEQNDTQSIYFDYDNDDFLIRIIDVSGLTTNIYWEDEEVQEISQITYKQTISSESTTTSTTCGYLASDTITNSTKYVNITDDLKGDSTTYYFDNVGRLSYSLSADPVFEEETYNKIHYDEKKKLYDVTYSNKDKLLSLSLGTGITTEQTSEITISRSALSSNYIYKNDVPSNGLAFAQVKLLDSLLDYLKFNEITLIAEVLDSDSKTRTYTQVFTDSTCKTIGIPFVLKEIDQKITLKISATKILNFAYIDYVSIYKAEGSIYSYNSDENLIKEINGLSSIEYSDFVDDKPTKIKTIDEFGVIRNSYQFFDTSGKIIFEEDYLKNCKEYYYNEFGRIVEKREYNKASPTLAKISKYTYDEFGNISEVNGVMRDKDGNSPQPSFKYSPNSSKIISKKTASGQVMCYGYDFHTDDLLEISSDANGQGNNARMTYRYGLLTSLAHHGFSIDYVLDGKGRKKEIYIAGQKMIENSFNDYYTNSSVSCGSRTYSKHINGYEIEIIKDKKGKIITSTDNDYNDLLFTYDDKDRLINVDEHNSRDSIEYSYNDDLLVQYSTYTDTVTINEDYSYNDKKLLQKVSRDIDGSVINTIYYYDEEHDNRLYKTELENIINQEVEYDTLGRVTKKTLSDDEKVLIEDEFEYLQYGENAIDLIKDHNVKVGGKLLDTTSYEYDVSGNITSFASGNFKTKYTYDSLNRLIREDNPILNQTIVYKYDNGGNILLKKIYDYTLDEELYNGEVIHYTYKSSGWKDQLIDYNGLEISYDEMGRPLNFGETQINWNLKGQMTSFGDNSYTYNINGIRTSKKVNGVTTTFYLSGDKILRENYNDIDIFYFYTMEKLSGFDYNGDIYIYERNIQGDVLRIYKKDGLTLVAEYQYDGYGNHKIINYTDDNIGDINPFRYRGYYFDEETQLFYCNSRYYSPELCRWISPDSIEYLDPESINGLNLYCYCYNNPISYSDPSGNLPQWAMWVIGGVVIAGLAIATIATGGAAGGVAGFILAGALKGAIVGAVSGALVNGTISGISSAVDGEGFWSGFFDGAAHGFMSGAVIGGITGAISSGAQVYNASKLWANTGNKTAYKQMVEHYGKHVIREGQKSVAKNIVNYSKQASQFFMNNSSSGIALRQGVIKIAGAPGGIFNIDGLIRSFWYI